MASTDWLATESPTPGEVHVAPLDDGITHAWEDCPCGPETRPQKREDGSVGWLVIHASLDGRELREAG